MNVTTYYLELIKKVILTDILLLKIKDKKNQKKNLVVHLLELIQVKKVMIQIMKLGEYKHLLVSLKTDN